MSTAPEGFVRRHSTGHLTFRFNIFHRERLAEVNSLDHESRVISDLMKIRH